MKKWFNKNILHLLRAFTGALAVYFYWQFVGCIGGSCVITSNPINSTIYGVAPKNGLLSVIKKFAI